MPQTTNIREHLNNLQDLASADEAGDLQAHKELLTSIRGLQLEVETPFETLFRLNFQSLQNIAIRIATEKHWFHVLAAAKGRAIKAADIAQQTDTNPLITARFLRLLAATGLCEEVGVQTYAANHRTDFYSQPGTIAGVKFHQLRDYMRSHDLQLTADDSNTKTLFQFTYNKNNLFELIETLPEQKKLFDEYMSWRDRGQQCGWFEIYPAEEWLPKIQCQPDQALVVDIGGGKGEILARFRDSHPNHPGRLILQDLPSTFQHSAQPPAGIERMEHDFFAPQPVQGGCIYLLSRVLHDWSDLKCENILSNIVSAMDPDISTLLIVDRVLDDQGVDLGEASFDILMWMNYSAMERSTQQWQDLLRRVGLQLVKIWRSSGASECALEVKVQRAN
ncbi:S-adenosyl-L-methionine-dependent methyltransferase [Aspergillus floccosus]